MTWVLFDESDRRKPAPFFDLPGILGGKVGLGDYRGQENLVVFFAHNPAPDVGDGCPGCRAALHALAARMAEIRATGSELLAVVPGPVFPPAMEELAERLPFPVVVDTEGKARAAYAALMAGDFTARGEVMLFLLDEFGAVYVAWTAPELDVPAVHPATLKWLEYIAMQCPE